MGSRKSLMRVLPEKPRAWGNQQNFEGLALSQYTEHIAPVEEEKAAAASGGSAATPGVGQIGAILAGLVQNAVFKGMRGMSWLDTLTCQPKVEEVMVKEGG